MLVSEYVEHLVQIRPYKYATKQTLIRDVKKLAMWDKDIDEATLIRWVKEVLTEDGIASHEAIVEGKINAIANPPIVPQKAEFPWLANTFTIE